MRKLIEAAFVSLDGVVESAEKWAQPYYSVEENKEHSFSRLRDCDAMLFGRATFELFESIGAMVKGDPFFDFIGGMRKFVASKTLPTVAWNGEVIQGDVAEEVARLKQQPGRNIMKFGTGDLDRTLIAHKLIDEFHLSIFPVVVGKGKRLFEGVDTSQLKLELIGTTKFKNGALKLEYARV